MALFAITRGQWGMIDALHHVLTQVGPASLSVWTWHMARFDLEVLLRLADTAQLTDALLIIDSSLGRKTMTGLLAPEATLLTPWLARFGAESVRYVILHAKMATVTSASGLHLLLRGSMNLNHSPRFEQFDLTEGGEDYALVKQLEAELPPLLATKQPEQEIRRVTGLGDQLPRGNAGTGFAGLRPWHH